MDEIRSFFFCCSETFLNSEQATEIAENGGDDDTLYAIDNTKSTHLNSGFSFAEIRYKRERVGAHCRRSLTERETQSYETLKKNPINACSLDPMHVCAWACAAIYLQKNLFPNWILLCFFFWRENAKRKD